MENRTVSTGPAPDRDDSGSAGAALVVAGGAGGRGVAGYLPVTAIAWCAGCRDHTEFVVPVGLPDASDDELACLYCGWAVLLGSDVGRPDRTASAA